MTPQSVGVPDSRLVLGKHSGRHALSLRFEQLGHKFERRELDEIYRRFVVLADRIKRVQDSHLLELIHDMSDGNLQTKKLPSVPAVEIPGPRAATAGVGSYEAFQAHAHSLNPTPRGNSFGENHSDHEDYLWGV